MGLTYIAAKVSGEHKQEQRLDMLIDSGAQYSLLPLEVWQKLDLKPKRRVTAILADGTRVQRDVSDCRISLLGELEGVEGPSPVILGLAGDEPIIGVVTLENLGLILDPYQRVIRPMQVRM